VAIGSQWNRAGLSFRLRSGVHPRHAELRHGCRPLCVRLAADELAAAQVEDLQQREEHWVFADLVGKGGHIRTVPIPDWIAEGVRLSLTEAGVTGGAAFRAINKAGRIASLGFSPKVIWGVVEQASARCGLANVAPHDLRRTCARLCHQAGRELKQIQFLLGHISVQTTERYLGCKQRLRNPVNDRIGLSPQP
jgi:integrase